MKNKKYFGKIEIAKKVLKIGNKKNGYYIQKWILLCYEIK